MALLHALVFGVHRWRGRLDWIIGRLVDQPLRKVGEPVRNVLRLGLFQLFFMDRIPPSAAVNTSVELAGRRIGPRVTGFVNAVLRNALRRREEWTPPAFETDPVAHLVIGQSMPEWLVHRWMDRYGLEETRRFCEAVNRIPPCTLRANGVRTNRSELSEILAGEGVESRPTPHSPDGLVLERFTGSVTVLEAFQRGLFQVQDEAAQLVSRALAPRPGERVLDACAGLGGKTGHIAGLMENRGEIRALDVALPKLARLGSDMDRLGVRVVTNALADLERPLTAEWGGFDRILLDAPCSGLGVLRRNPDAKWDDRKREGGPYRERQLRFLTHLAPVLNPGGRLVYAVCSTEPDEGEDVIAAFLAAHSEFKALDVRAVLAAGGVPGTVGVPAADGLRTFPHHQDMDGFFIAALERKS